MSLHTDAFLRLLCNNLIGIYTSDFHSARYWDSGGHVPQLCALLDFQAPLIKQNSRYKISPTGACSSISLQSLPFIWRQPLTTALSPRLPLPLDLDPYLDLTKHSCMHNYSPQLYPHS